MRRVAKQGVHDVGNELARADTDGVNDGQHAANMRGRRLADVDGDGRGGNANPDADDKAP